MGDIFSECKLLRSATFTERQNSFLGVMCWGFFSTWVHYCFGLLSKSAVKVRLLDAAGNELFGQGMRLIPYCLHIVTWYTKEVQEVQTLKNLNLFFLLHVFTEIQVVAKMHRIEEKWLISPFILRLLKLKVWFTFWYQRSRQVFILDCIWHAVYGIADIPWPKSLHSEVDTK